MKIAGMGFTNKKVSLMNPYLRLWAQNYNPKQAYHKGMDFSKTYYQEAMPNISISGTAIDGKSKKINNKWVFPNARKLPQEAENFINQKELQIETLRKEISDYLNEHFLEWDFVTIEEVLNFKSKNEIDKEQEQKYQIHVRKVIRQLDMTKDELKKEI